MVGVIGIADLHACMGDGEVCGTGIETPGTVTLCINVIKKRGLEHPVVETRNAVYFLNSDRNFETAGRNAVLLCVNFLKEHTGLSFADAYRLTSVVCDLRVSQIVNGVITAKVRLPRTLLHGKGFLR